MSTKEITIANKLNDAVSSVIGSDKMQGFERAFQIASAAQELKQLLTPEYMKPIMALQGNKLGFKTDKDDSGGYKEDVVKNCLIEAVLTGVEPFGNHFNIIAGNCYITKEGFGHLLRNYPGLTYEIIPSLPRIKDSSAAVVMKIFWTWGGKAKDREIDFAIKVNKFMGTDAVIGKATRKARAWLFHTINGIEVADGDVMDIDSRVMSSTLTKSKEEIERERIVLMINDAKTLEDLKAIEPHVPEELFDLYTVKMDSINES